MTQGDVSPQSVHNLIIGLAGPYGSGCSSLAEELTNYIGDWPGCHVEMVRVSDLIAYWYPIISGSELGLPDGSSATRRKSLQAAGTALRKHDPDFVGEAITHYILTRACEIEKTGILNGKGTVVFIVDSLKNQHDVDSLRRVYGREFFFSFVHANKDIRWRRMRDYKSWRNDEERDFYELDAIDSHEKETNPDVGDAGQQVRKLAEMADYFIVNNINRERLVVDGKRFFKILMGGDSNQPTVHERCMHIAYSASNRSYCLSRQVGAAIFDRFGDILSVGHNDAPKAGGGLYCLDDESDSRCYLVGDRQCANFTQKEERFDKLAERLCDNFPFNQHKENVRKAIANSEFREATEFCRAVHAEMEAIIGVARHSRGTTLGASMYVTTEPCHNCTKHIISSGIKKVIYFEPYPKSLAKELHSDATIFDPPEQEELETKKVLFIPYQGVAPRRFHDFFSMEEKRKGDNGRLERLPKLERANNPRFAKGLSRRSRTGEPPSQAIQVTYNEYAVASKFEKISGIAEPQEASDGRHEEGTM